MKKHATSGCIAGCLAAMVLELVSSAPASAAGGCPTLIRVPKQAASIDAAIAQACPGVPLEIVVAPGTWTMSAEVPGSTALNITIRGAGGGETIVTDEAPGVPLCFAPSGSMAFEIRMKDLTVADVTGSESRMTFDNCLVRDCSGSFLSYGGATIGSRFERCNAQGAYGVLYTGVDVVDCEFIDCARPIHFWGDNPCAARGCTFNGSIDHAVRCWASCCSGGNNIYTFEDCSFTGTAGNAVKLEYTPHPDAQTVRTNFVGCTFTDNVSPAGGFGGGAVRVGITDLPAPLNGDDTLTTFTNCTFTGNSAPSGGAIFMAKNHPVVLDNCTFAANVAAAGDGGAICEQTQGGGISLSAADCTFVGNHAVPVAAQGGIGGAINAAGWFGALELDACTFRQNTSASGGAVACDRSTFVVQNCMFEDNESSVDGGAVTVSTTLAGSMVRGTTFRGNSAMRHGGALEMPFFITVPFEDCVFDTNSAAQTGGAVRVWYNPAVGFLRCRFHANTALLGTSVYAFNYGSPLAVTLDACTISNEAPGSASGWVIEADGSGAAVGDSVICGCSGALLSPNVADSGGNCISEYCTDFDANGVPDACECATNPALPSCCLGDLYNDGAVNAADLAVVLTQWGEKGTGLAADLDGNGVVNGVDLAIVLSNWGPCD